MYYHLKMPRCDSPLTIRTSQKKDNFSKIFTGRSSGIECYSLILWHLLVLFQYLVGTSTRLDLETHHSFWYSRNCIISKFFQPDHEKKQTRVSYLRTVIIFNARTPICSIITLTWEAQYKKNCKLFLYWKIMAYYIILWQHLLFYSIWCGICTLHDVYFFRKFWYITF